MLIGIRTLSPGTMRPTKRLGDASRPPSADPGTSLLLIAAILATLVAIAHPLWSFGTALAVAAGLVLRRTVRLSGSGYICVPKLDRCYRIVPS